ncbi:MAG: hypothetical protein OEV40_21185 [Acidimicrobiia bacterium]|nr:hypothetical protein [Acidimicrobiia bacterium]
MDTETYQALIRAHQRELMKLRPRREQLAARARARSARRWADDHAKVDQQRRAGRLRLVVRGTGDQFERAS